jgi:hypothetical protein
MKGPNGFQIWQWNNGGQPKLISQKNGWKQLNSINSKAIEKLFLFHLNNYFQPFTLDEFCCLLLNVFLPNQLFALCGLIIGMHNNIN